MLKQRCARWGWSNLFVWALFGFALETLHAFKSVSYLENELTRLLLTLAHAHGVGLSLVVILFGFAGTSLFGSTGNEARNAAFLILSASVLVPVGFVLGAVGHPEGDPSLGILLAPAGALALLLGVFQTARAAWTETSDSPSQDTPDR